ncbi:hypothetical protein F4809DRAFT_612740 [Biscogniauxia mediterranea]|nr:hypothetical protein F4809DRAFT_612740 [Biscogniauxia mediterranea]
MSLARKSLPEWPNPTDSIRRQILSWGSGKQKAWWPRGPAVEKFEIDIQPKTEDIIRNIDTGNAEVFIRLYMIGRKPEEANPIIMICCRDSTARKMAEDSVRSSNLLSRYPGFGLGGASLPLENPRAARRLAGSVHRDESGSTICDIEKPLQPIIVDSLMRTLCDAEPVSSLIFSTSRQPVIGRRLFAASPNGDGVLHTATGGIILDIGGKHYQMTVGHLCEPKIEMASMDMSANDLDECHFDGQSDDDQLLPEDYETNTLSHGSATPAESRSRAQSSEPMDENHTSPSGGSTDEMDVSYSQANAPSPQPLTTLFDPTAELIGFATQSFQSHFQHPLDYALIYVSSDDITGMGQFQLNSTIAGDPSKGSSILNPLRVDKIGHIGTEERRALVVTASSGSIQGVVSPGAISYRQPKSIAFQKLHLVQLETAVVEGDCGSPVVDAKTGDLYGHLVLGVENTCTAYLLEANQIILDITNRMDVSVSVAKSQPLFPTYIPSYSDLNSFGGSTAYNSISTGESVTEESVGASSTSEDYSAKRCDECSKVFKGKWASTSLSRHIRTNHSKQLRFICPYCEKQFTRADDFSMHVKRFHPAQANDTEIRNESHGKTTT